mmetsp:Transcript_12577/g.30803  ORF Transcript_12577/g.30803 Transcript_12577/m.30803 type:complete len:83 (+) Transcript_12577:85-333(+)
MLWLGVYYLLTAETVVCLALISLGHMPLFIQRPIRKAITNLHIPKAQEVAVAIIVVLIALFAESVRKGLKHSHVHTDDFKDK